MCLFIYLLSGGLGVFFLLCFVGREESLRFSCWVGKDPEDQRVPNPSACQDGQTGHRAVPRLPNGCNQWKDG